MTPAVSNNSNNLAAFSLANFSRLLMVGLVVCFVANLLVALVVVGMVIDGERVAALAAPAFAFALTATATALIWRSLRGVAAIDARFAEARRARAALDVASASMMIADKDMTITYVMPALEQSLAKSREFWARKDNPVDISSLVGKNIDVFHKNPGHNRGMLTAMRAPMLAKIAFDEREFDLRVSPISGAQGVREGYVVEWVEKTEAQRSAKLIADVIDAAMQGDFAQRIDMSRLTPETRAVANALYEVYGNLDGYFRDIDAVLRALAQGDLTRRMPKGHRGVFEGVAGSVNETIDRLAELVGRIRDTGEALRDATADIATGSGALSSRAESQAASLEQTAATMEQMASTVKSNAENTVRSNSQASDASARAAEGRVVVSQAVDAMDLIEKSATRIADITSLIDSIAFQTNLLALNASVEAARAGDAGRGFAVVASEVRTLAQRSADAARDIKGLIAESSTHVEQGVMLVQKSGHALDSIAVSIAELAESIDEIASASREQSAGVEEISTAVMRMDEMTQQNAGLAEQSAAAARGLEGRARELGELVGFFRLDAHKGRAAPIAHEALRAAE